MMIDRNTPSALVDRLGGTPSATASSGSSAIITTSTSRKLKLAVALGVPPKRSTSALGVFLSIIMVVAYHKVNQYGEDIAALGRLDPFLALWGPFLLFAALIGWMYWRVAHVPGGQAIGALEIWFDKVAKRIGRLFRRRRLKIDLAAAE